MRVITGSARGKQLHTLDGLELRPTAARVKEGLFSAIQFDIEGRTVLDLFAGSGQLGIEALSRGASRAVFTDESAEAVKCITRNLASTGLADSATVKRQDYASYLMSCRESFDIIFVDPPYYRGFFENALNLAEQRLKPNGTVICEFPSDVTLPEKIGGLSVARSYRYGKIRLFLYRKESVSDE